MSLNFQGPDQFDPSLQTPVVNAVAAKKPDAVLIAPTDTKAMFAPINQLKQNGSKVVLVDTTLDEAEHRRVADRLRQPRRRQGGRRRAGRS